MASPTKRRKNDYDTSNPSRKWTISQVKSTQFLGNNSKNEENTRVKDVKQTSRLEDASQKSYAKIGHDQTLAEFATKPELVHNVNKVEMSKLEESSTNGSDNARIDKEDIPVVSSNETDTVTSGHPEKKRQVPLWKFKRGYLCVTDVTSQSWCEQQLLYSLTVPTIPVENKAMTTGTSMHLARELEVHDIVSVSVTSKEDSWAIKLLNMIDGVSRLSCGIPCIREIPIFGEPFGKGIFLVGIIDEVRYSEKGEFQLCEFKSRANSRTLPSKAQRRNHKLQVMIYKQLFDALVRGDLKKESILEHVKLDESKILGEEIMKHLRNSGIICQTFGDLLDIALLKFQFSDLPSVDSLIIEYSFQGDCQSFASDQVSFDSDWLNVRLDHYFSFWRGDRDVMGVDIEEAWKCHSCDFSDICEWKKMKEQECLTQNKT